MKKQTSGVGPVGILLRQARLHAGLTERQVADVLGMSTMAVQHWEKGHSIPSREIATGLARLYRGTEFSDDEFIIALASAIGERHKRFWLNGGVHED